MPPSAKLTHFDKDGNAHMVDVSDKETTSRIAVASGFIHLTAYTLTLIKERAVKKGDVLTVAELSGIMAAKQTSTLIPLCHPLPLSGAKLKLHTKENGVHVEATVKTTGKTGVEMEALTAVSVACLTVYDMVKAVDKAAKITDIQLDQKSGGKSGNYTRKP